MTTDMSATRQTDAVWVFEGYYCDSHAALEYDESRPGEAVLRITCLGMGSTNSPYTTPRVSRRVIRGAEVLEWVALMRPHTWGKRESRARANPVLERLDMVLSEEDASALSRLLTEPTTGIQPKAIPEEAS